jgi:hypothetical protein
MTTLFLILGALALLLITRMGVADPGTLGAFNDFMAATRQRPMSTPDKISNQMTAQRTYMSRKMQSGLSEDEYFQDGTEFIDQVQLKYVANARNYNPTATQSPTGSDSLTTIKAPWRFTLVDSVWYDHEILLNNNGDQSTIFKRLMKVKRQKMFTDLWDKVESDYFALPDSVSMEGGNQTGVDPYSLLAFVTRDGLVPAAGNGGILSGSAAWTAIETVSPTAFPNWANQSVTYDSADLEGNIESALDDAWLLARFESPDNDSGKTGMEETTMDKYMIATNREGYRTLVKIARNSTSNPTKPSNLGWAMGNLTYNGTRVDYISALDSTTLVPAGKPDFFLFNFKHIHNVFHKNRYLLAKTFEGTVGQPMANVEYRDTWRNLVCKNRREQARVSAA